MSKYTIRWKGPNREFDRDTDDPLVIIDALISFHKHEEGRYIGLPNYWDKLIIEKHQKITASVQSSTENTREIKA